jgi:hypothetical protein
MKAPVEKNTEQMLKTAGEMLKQEHLEKVALEKVARAQKLAFRKVEMGIVEPFTSYEAMTKEAEAILKDGDLDLTERAMDLGITGGHRSGELTKQASSGAQPTDVFNHFVLTGELLTESN